MTIRPCTFYKLLELFPLSLAQLVLVIFTLASIHEGLGR